MIRTTWNFHQIWIMMEKYQLCNEPRKVTPNTQINSLFWHAWRESIPRLFNDRRTTMTTRCAPACSQALPVKPQGVWARGIETWAGSRDLRNLGFRRWGSPGGGTRVHHGRVGSAGLCDLKILHPWRRLKKGVKILQWPPPPNARKGVNILHQYEKSAKKGGQKSTILKYIGVKILQVWKWGSKFYMLKNRGQNSTMLEKRGVNILHPTPKVEVKILHRLKKGGQKGRAYPLPKI